MVRVIVGAIGLLVVGCSTEVQVERETRGAGGHDPAGGAGGAGNASSTGGSGGSIGIGGAGGNISTGGVGGVGGTGNCMPGAKQCVGNTPEICNEIGQWQSGGPCPSSASVCVDGSCIPPSCVGLPSTCGPLQNENCCASALVPGGTYNRSNDVNYPATVSDFVLDRFPVTVGRYRAFLAGYPQNAPATGAGAHPKIANSGWDAAFGDELPTDHAGLKDRLNCDVDFQTWTDAPSMNENLPINCLHWAMAFAFCAWDGGYLPTEAEWNRAAAGGDEQREYPWSNPPSAMTIDATYASYDCIGDGSGLGDCAFSDIAVVGSRSPTGDGKWGHADMAGNLWEWILDWSHVPYMMPCDNCADLQSPNGYRVIRGGSWYNSASWALTSLHGAEPPNDSGPEKGVRCARSP